MNTAPGIALIERLCPGISGQFSLCEIPAEDGFDTWELGAGENGRIRLAGSGPLALASAFGYYLKHTLHCNLSWCGTNLTVPEVLPRPEATRRVIRQRYRVYMNYCTHSYSAAWWDWERWQREIDMMALHGINMPLAITGTECVWYDTLLELGFTDEEARDFLCGPGFFAWQWMTNLEHHGGPLPKSWLKNSLILGRQILQRELEFGMLPIQQGFSGFVPMKTAEKFPEARIQVKKVWNSIGPTAQLDPTDPLFETIGLAFFRNLQKLFGTHGYYAADPFHEGYPPVDGPEYLHKVGDTIAKLMAAYDPGYTWVMQAWSIRKDIATAVDKNHLLVLDLVGDHPENKEGYWGFPFVVGTLHNFGARMSLHGDLRHQAENKFLLAREKYPNACGTGLFMEGIGQNPVFYDLALDMLTSDGTVELELWLRGYCRRRYGGEYPDAEAAWKLLSDNVYVRDSDFVERGSIACTRPALSIIGTGPCDTIYIHYDPKILPRALELLEKLGKGTEGLEYDKLDICRQMLSNLIQKQYYALREDFLAGRTEAFEAKKADFLSYLRDFDTLLSLRKEWRIQTWIENARAFGTTKAEKDQYEYNARAQVTIWGNEEKSLLFDYAWKEWSGLTGTYYLPRWEIFLNMLSENPDYRDENLTMFEDRIIWRASPFYESLADWENRWVNSTDEIPIPETDDGTLERMLAKYIPLTLA